MNKSIFFLALLSFTLGSCYQRNGNHASTNREKANYVPSSGVKTRVKIIDSVFNFGKVSEGEKVVYNFRFQNIGDQPLVIASATASCGCTVPERPEEPIAPGEFGAIKIVFDSQGRPGQTHKEVEVVSNAEPQFPTLVIAGEVVSK